MPIGCPATWIFFSMNRLHALLQKRWLWFAAVGLAVLLTYSNSFHNDFEFDDFHTVVNNPAIRSLKNIPRFFTDATTFSVLPTNRTYRPVVSTTLALDYALGGYKPLWFHVSTFVVYLAQLAAMFLFFRTLLRRISSDPRSDLAAILAVAWYGLHPAMAETVNYIIQRGDIYSTAGVVVSLALYAAKPSWRRTGLYLLPFGLALLSKPPAIVMVALLPLYVAMFETTAPRWRSSLLAAVPVAATGAALMWLQAAMTPKTYAPSTLSNYSYCITQPFVLMRYFASFFLPLHLGIDSDLKAFDGLSAKALLGVVFAAALLVIIWRTARTRGGLPIAYGLAWFLIASVPTSVYRLSEVENDHRMYMPFVGLTLAVTWSAYLCLRRLFAISPSGIARKAVAAALLLLLGSYAYGAHLRNAVWHDDLSVWKDNVEKNPENGRGLMNYGLALMGRGQFPQAMELFHRAEAYTPNYPSLEINLGVVSGVMGLPETRAHFERAIRLAPTDDQTHMFFGQWLMRTGQLPEAITQLQTAASLNPARTDIAEALHRAQALQASALHNPAGGGADAWISTSLARYQARDYMGSIDAAQQALKLNPNLAAAYNNIGASYAAMGRWNDAIEADQKAIGLDPSLEIARNNLKAAQVAVNAQQPNGNTAAATPEQLVEQSLHLYQAGDYRGSIRAAQAALKLQPRMAQAWNNIAAAHAAMREWDAAISAAQNAIRLDPSLQIAKNNLAWAIREKQKQTAR